MDGNSHFFRLGVFMENVKALKKYGQNFLKNKEVLKKISSLVEVSEKDLILEIGPGMGALTEFLTQKNSFLLCYEIDERMKTFLNKYETNRTKVIYDDFMKRDILKDLSVYPCENLFVVANIPYYITSPILLKLIHFPVAFQKIVLLVQKEFAERLAALPGQKEYNALTLFVDYYYDVKINCIVPNIDFMPAPKVDSAVIELNLKERKEIFNKEGYFLFIKEAFQNKRKTLKNNLKKYDWSIVLPILQDLGYMENVRAEEISKEDFVILWERLEKELHIM